MFNFGEYADICHPLLTSLCDKAAKHRYIFLRGVGMMMKIK